MANLTAASESHKQEISLQDVEDVVKSIGLQIKPEQVGEWHEIIASVQKSIDIVNSLPDYFPEVNTDKYPRLNGKKEGPLSGVSLCLKDNIAVKDVPMLLGTDMFTVYVPKTDATLLTRLLEAGGAIEGKAVCENLSVCASSFSAATGPVENPYAAVYTTGGSSSGCGHLVGVGEVMLASAVTKVDPSVSPRVTAVSWVWSQLGVSFLGPMWRP
ncbi:amidase-domain-containing protein [Xylariales sp. PMI_506]|nr:amidase-domain-containing protein [Xylariales sp. PMI_506]